MHLNEYLAALFHGWVGKMSGIASIALAFLAIYFPRLFADPKSAARSLWIAAAICFLIANYSAWLSKRNALEDEQKRHTGSDIRGEILRGYLDLNSYVQTSGGLGHWTYLESGCDLRLYIEAANHNDQATWFKPEHARLELRIGDKCFDGKRLHVWGLEVDDPEAPANHFSDMFGVLKDSPLQQGTPWKGYVGFFIENFDRTLLTDHDAITADVKVEIPDTLDKPHVIEGSEIRLLIGKLKHP